MSPYNQSSISDSSYIFNVLASSHFGYIFYAVLIDIGGGVRPEISLGEGKFIGML